MPIPKKHCLFLCIVAFLVQNTGLNLPLCAETPQLIQDPSLSRASKYSAGYSSDATSYPTVSALELAVFRQTYANADIQERLNRLEKQVFGYTRPQLDLVDRVDDLLSKYPLALKKAGEIADNEVYASKESGTTQGRAAQSSRAKVSRYQQRRNSSRSSGLSGQRIYTQSPQTNTAPSVSSGSSRLLPSNGQLAGQPGTIRFSQQTQRYTTLNPQFGLGVQPNNTLIRQRQAGLPLQTTQRRDVNIQFSGFNTAHFSSEFLEMLPPGIRQRLESQSTGNPTGMSVQTQQILGQQQNQMLPYSTTSVQQNTQRNTPLNRIETLEFNLFGEVKRKMLFLERLKQLELSLLGRAFSTQSVDTRLVRLETAFENNR
ncbi:MAG: hypothetical protein AAGI66_02435 [Cyanobacteria bacterium P01_H01_bin.74]